MTDEVRKIKQTRDRLNAVSPSFCTAKWLQVTMHLQNGHTHSCHHPQTHKIPLEELRTNPTALHNTELKKKQRRMMLDGTRPKECQYCWNVEDLGEDRISDRYLKSHDTWALPHLDTIAKSDWKANVNPRYVEVSFSNVCNLKCSYCSPAFSSKWVEEIVQHGPYPTSDKFNNLDWLQQQNKMPIPHRESNPYVEAFWKWFPDLYKTLEVFRITGGEPLMSKDTFKVFDYIIDNPNPNLELSINSNACVPDVLFDKYIEKMKRITGENKVGRTRLYTSVDTWGVQAEYIRDGFNYYQWHDNIEKVLKELPLTKVTVMCTTNLLSMPNFHHLVDDIYHWKNDFYSNERRVPITLDMAILRHPVHQSAVILPPEYASMMNPALAYMESHAETHSNPYKGFFDFEIEKMKRFIEYVKAGPNEAERINLDVSRKDFKYFIDEHDRRRGTNFKKTFPELVEFYNLCGQSIKELA
tara:strand:- start:738 stop:2144 length:1407 start_codon:yes stop_codon:yes gene_type:complete